MGDLSTDIRIRLTGVLETAGGLLQMSSAVPLAPVPALSGAVALFGGDHAAAGLATVLTGEIHDAYATRAARWLARKARASTSTAETIAQAVEVASTLGLSAWAMSARSIAVYRYAAEKVRIVEVCLSEEAIAQVDFRLSKWWKPTMDTFLRRERPAAEALSASSPKLSLAVVQEPKAALMEPAAKLLPTEITHSTEALARAPAQLAVAATKEPGKAYATSSTKLAASSYDEYTSIAFKDLHPTTQRDILLRVKGHPHPAAFAYQYEASGALTFGALEWQQALRAKQDARPAESARK